MVILEQGRDNRAFGHTLGMVLAVKEPLNLYYSHLNLKLS